jgi:hypothetical protein
MRMLIRLASAIVMMVMLMTGARPLRAAEIRVEASIAKNSITAIATNELGQPAAGAVVSFQLPAQGPSGLFANGLRSEIVVAGTDGRATVNGIRWDEGTAPITVRVTASKGGARTATMTEWRAALPPAAPSPVESAVSSNNRSLETRKAPEPDTAIPVYRGGSGWGKKLMWVGMVAGGVAAGSLVAQSRRTATGTSGAQTGALVTAPPGLSVGAPIITVGRP